MGAVRANCWQVRGCGRGPDSPQSCPAATDIASDGVNDGACAGRICWTVPGTDCFGEPQGSFVDKLDTCLACEFLAQVKSEQGEDFRLLKLGQGVYDAPELHGTISRLESFLRIPEDLHAQFDLRRLIDRITEDARRAVDAERSVVFLTEGDPPLLRGEMLRRDERVRVEIPLDETSAVGTAAVRNGSVNVRDPRGPADGDADPDPVVFNEAFDRQCNVRTRSLLAVPIRSTGGEPLGVLTAANSAHGQFSADDQWFMEQYALQAGLALEKERLLADSRFIGRLATFGESLVGLSHSLRGITHALSGLGYIIRHAERAGRPQGVEAACRILDRQVERIAALSRGISEYEVERGGEPEVADLNEVVSDVVRALSEEADARVIALQADLDNSLHAGVGERTLVYRLMVNLLSHALNACPCAEGEVEVRTRSTGNGEAIIEVSHNGAALAPIELDAREWRDTCQAHATQTIGLPTALHLARALGGHLESCPSPNGTTLYRATLPVV